MCRYLNELAVHPDFQKLKVGSKLIDQGISWASSATPPLAILLESTPAGRRLYESQGFIKEDEYPVGGDGTYAGMEEIRFPLYRVRLGRPSRQRSRFRDERDVPQYLTLNARCASGCVLRSLTFQPALFCLLHGLVR